MVIKKQPVISWLLEKTYPFNLRQITVQDFAIHENIGYSLKGLNHLKEIRDNHPNWGLPTLIMSSFKKAMKESAQAFKGVDHQLFLEFQQDCVCGILIEPAGTIVYGFGEDNNGLPTLYVWMFKTINDTSILYNNFHVVSTDNNTRRMYYNPSLMDDPGLITNQSTSSERKEIYHNTANLIVVYHAVKKYAETKTIIVPPQSISVIEDTITVGNNKEADHNEKVKNDSGQQVIVMDSRWFVKIVNDNEIPVRPHFRHYWTKDSSGECHKVLKFISLHNRHGYHRNAKIEDN